MSAALDTLPDMPASPPPPLAPVTERDMLDLLHKRFGHISQNGGVPKPRYVKAEHVRARSGFFERGAPMARTADFVAVDTWVSGRCAIHGVEIKVSRSDWLAELKDPAKSAAVRTWCTHWWLAVPHAGVAKPEELPDGWGLLIVRGASVPRLVARVNAPRRDVPPVPPESMVSLLYAAARTAAARGTA